MDNRFVGRGTAALAQVEFAPVKEVEDSRDVASIRDSVQGVVASAKRLFAERLREARDEAGLTEEGLAELTGQLAPQSTLNNWSQAKVEPGAFRLLAVAEALGVSLDYLLGRTSRPQEMPAGHTLYGLREQHLKALLRETDPAKLERRLRRDRIFTRLVAVSTDLPRGMVVVDDARADAAVAEVLVHCREHAPDLVDKVAGLLRP